MKTYIMLMSCAVLLACQPKHEIVNVPQWTICEIPLVAKNEFVNPYTDVDVWVEFNSDRGTSLIRPAFWDGGNVWRVRFTPPDTGSMWRWTSFSSADDDGLNGRQGIIQSDPYAGENTLLKHGLLRMSPKKRNVIHADGTPFLVVGDTPWSLPFRATSEQVRFYAEDRQQKGFNTALLMSVQPDRYADGPESRDSIGGFARAFRDLPDGHLNQLVPGYFQTLDELIDILIEHEIVPVIQPVFHGFGWKGKTVLGTTADPLEYSRYCKYLVARYGSSPAFWLVSADGTGRDPGVKPAGETIEKWDAYGQPTGIHYNPADNYLPTWAQGDSSKAFHYNRTYQDQPWLDFQWAQSGHDGEHITYKVREMYDNTPVKAVLNGEPTYEGMGGGKLGLGWWQGEEAWTQLMHGGTMGVVYGAATLWQWKITRDEPGWDTWTDQPLSWREAVKLEGSKYVGHVSKAFKGFDYVDMERRWDLTDGKHPLLAKEGVFYVAYLASGGDISINGLPEGLPWYQFNPITGELNLRGQTGSDRTFNFSPAKPAVLLIGNRSHRRL